MNNEFKNFFSFLLIISMLSGMFSFIPPFVFVTMAEDASNPEILNELWKADFDSETIRTFTARETYSGDVTYLVDHDISYGVSGEIIQDPDNSENKAVKFTHTKKGISFATWIELGRVVNNGIKPTGTNKILITEARIYMSSDTVDSYLYNYYWNGYGITKATEKNIPADKRISERWVLYKTVIDISTGEYEFYLDGIETASGTADAVQRTALQSYGVWPQIRAFADDSSVGYMQPLAKPEYMLIDYIRVGEPTGTLPSEEPSSSPSASPAVEPDIEIDSLWNADFDNEVERQMIDGSVSNNVNYVATDWYKTSNEIVADPQDSQNKLLKMIHKDNNLQWQNWIQAPDGTGTQTPGSGGIKAGSDGILITEARIKLSSSNVCAQLQGLFFNSPENRTRDAFIFNLPLADRVADQWMIFRNVININTGGYTVYLDGAEIGNGNIGRSGTDTEVILEAIASKGLWPKLNAYATVGASDSMPQYLLVDYYKTGIPKNENTPTVSPTVSPSASPSAPPEPIEADYSGLPVTSALWYADFDSDPLGNIPHQTLRAYNGYSINYVADPLYNVTANIVTDPDNQTNRLLKFTHTQKNISYATWVQPPMSEPKYGVKLSEGNSLFITEARIYAPTIYVDSYIYNYYWDEAAQKAQWAFQENIPPENRTAAKWIIFKSVIDIYTGKYYIYFDGVKIKEGTASQTACLAFQKNGIFPQIRPFATDAGEPRDFLIDYIKTGESAYPEVLSSTPENGVVKVNVNTDEIVITFSKNMLESSLNSENIKIIDSYKNTQITYTDYSYDSAAYRYILKLPETLKFSTKYKVVLSTDVLDIYKVPLNSEKEINFSTTDMISIEGLKLVKDGASDITALSSGKISGKISLKNNNSQSRNVVVVTALYRKIPDADALIKLTFKNEALAANITAEINTGEITVPDNSNNQYRIKIFVLENITGYLLYTAPIIFDERGKTVEEVE